MVGHADGVDIVHRLQVQDVPVVGQEEVEHILLQTTYMAPKTPSISLAHQALR